LDHVLPDSRAPSDELRNPSQPTFGGLHQNPLGRGVPRDQAPFQRSVPATEPPNCQTAVVQPPLGRRLPRNQPLTSRTTLKDQDAPSFNAPGNQPPTGPSVPDNLQPPGWSAPINQPPTGQNLAIVPAGARARLGTSPQLVRVGRAISPPRVGVHPGIVRQVVRERLGIRTWGAGARLAIRPRRIGGDLGISTWLESRVGVEARRRFSKD
jgi:hypothetical protein